MISTPPSLLRPLLVAGSLAVVAGCTNVNLPFIGPMSGAADAPAGSQATAARPAPDAAGVISYPNYQVAVARPGDTVATLSARLGLDAAEVARTNGLPENAPLRPEEVVLLPAGSTPAGGAGAITPGGEVSVETLASEALDRAGPGTSAAAPAGTAAAGQGPRRHRVARGETAYTIARQYDISVRSLADWNGLGESLSVREGQVLLIPVATASPAPQQEVAATALPGTGSRAPVPPSAASPQPGDEAPATTPARPQTSGVPAQQTAASDTTRLAQPVSGRIIRGYQKGQNDGLDFSAPPGAPVRAADGGTVAAITQDVDQVPIVVIRHPNNVLTVYANVGEVNVQKGDTVARGQNIATVRGGDSSFLHFEVREGFDSVDPVPYLTQ